MAGPRLLDTEIPAKNPQPRRAGRPLLNVAGRTGAQMGYETVTVTPASRVMSPIVAVA
jgi:hypothetical protein